MVQIIPQAETFGGKLGTGLSEGFAQTFPKELERTRLASGLKDMQNFKGTESERISALATQPGMTPQLMQIIYPYLRQESLRRNLEKNELNQIGEAGNPIENGSMPDRQFASPQGVQPQQDTRLSDEGMNRLSQVNPALASKILANQQQMPQVAPQDKSGLITPEAEFASRQPIYRKSPQQIQQRAFQLNDMGYPIDESNAMAQKEADTEYANAIEERNLKDKQLKSENDVQNAFDAAITKKIQGTPNISGEVQDNLMKRALRDVDGGMTQNQAVKKWTDKALELEKTLTSLKNNIGSREWIGPGSPKFIQDLETARKAFEEVNGLENFKDYITANLDVGPKMGNFIAFKPSKEKEKFYSSLNPNDDPKKIAANIAKQIKPEESINAISYILNKKGIDADQVIDNIQKYSNDNLIELSNRQDRELQEYTPVTTTDKGMGNILYNAFFNPFAFLATEGSKFIAESIGASKPKESTYERVKKLLGKK